MTKLRYFAWVRERIGKPEEDVEIPAGVTTVAELMTWLSGRGEEYAYAFDNPKVIRAAIDRSHVKPQADIAAPALSEGLAAAGAAVTAVTAYRTVDYPAAAERRLAVAPEDGDGSPQPPSYALLTPDTAAAEIAQGRIAAVIAASPSAVRRIAALGPLAGCRLVVIGRSTAEQATTVGLTVAAVAAEPPPEGLVAAVVKALNPP